jgi:hypothetical protein
VDKKNIAALLLKKPAPEMEVDESQDELIGMEASMEDFIKAVSAKDSKAAVSAFEALMAQCKTSEE